MTNPPMPGDPGRIMAALEKSWSKTCGVRLDNGETAWNPDSSDEHSRPIFGPCDITYQLRQDGAIVAAIHVAD